MAKKDKDPYGPVRKQDPYVTGKRGGYQDGGEVQPGTGGSGGGKKDEGCSDDAAKMVIAMVALGYLVKGFIARGRRR